MTNLKVTQGDEKPYNLTFSSGEGALDITGATVTMSIKRSLSDETPIKTINAVHTDAENGLSTITLSESDTSIPLGKYYYDMQISGGGVRKKTFAKGQIEITWQVTED